MTPSLIICEAGPAGHVSCDVATLARDARAMSMVATGSGSMTALDLFPNTAHVEVVAGFTR